MFTSIFLDGNCVIFRCEKFFLRWNMHVWPANTSSNSNSSGSSTASSTRSSGNCSNTSYFVLCVPVNERDDRRRSKRHQNSHNKYIFFVFVSRWYRARFVLQYNNRLKCPIATGNVDNVSTFTVWFSRCARIFDGECVINSIMFHHFPIMIGVHN